MHVSDPHRIQQCGHDSRTGASERVAERNRPTVHVEPFHINAKVPGGGDHLDSERLIDLHQIHVTDCHSGVGQSPVTGLDRSEPHDLRAKGAHTCCDNSGERGKAELGGTPITHDHHGRGSIVQRTAVAGCDRAVRAKGRL